MLRDALIARRGEIEQTTFARIEAISDVAQDTDPGYADALRETVAVAIDYAISTVEDRSESPPPVPMRLLSQARMAARAGVSLDTVLRRYFAGYTVLGQFTIDEVAKTPGRRVPTVQTLLRAQAELFDRVLSEVTQEYKKETRLPETPRSRRDRILLRILAGEPPGGQDLGYDLEGTHVGVVGNGKSSVRVMRDLAATLRCGVLVIRRPDGECWGWLAVPQTPRLDDLDRAASTWSENTRLAVGEPGVGLSGWRLTNRQARAAWPIALEGSGPLTAYRDVALLASSVRDDLLLESLHQIYLVPFEGDKDGGKSARETLQAYIDAAGNVSAAAASLGLSRQTVSARLRFAEQRLGRPLPDCTPELRVALKMKSYASARLSPCR